MKIAIVGSRNFPDPFHRVRKCLSKQKKLYGDRIVIITGGSGRVDWLAVNECVILGLRCIIIPANWEKYGNKAGPIRNQEIVKMADKVFAFWDGKSKGTLNIINLCEKYKKLLIIRREEDR